MARTAAIGVGIIGLSADGGWAATAHLPALRHIKGFAVNAVSASSPDSACRAAERHGIPHACASPEELAGHPDVDLVVVAVKVPHHRTLVEAALAAGKAVYCEWPLGRDLAEAEWLARRAQQAGAGNFVGLQARAVPAVRYLRQLIADGWVGDVLSTTIIGSGARWGETVPAASLYLTDRTNGATMLSIPVGHMLEGVESCLGPVGALNAQVFNRRTSVRIVETGEEVPVTAADQVLVQGKLARGGAVSIHYRGGLSRGTNFLWEINGTRGDLQITGPNGHMQYGLLTIRGGRQDDKDMQEMAVPDAFRPYPELQGSLVESVAGAYRDVLTDLTTGSRIAPDFAAAVNRHRMLNRIEAAAATGETR